MSKMKTFKYKKLLLVVAGILLVLLAVKSFCFFTAKPAVTMDYVSQLNQTSQPQNVDPDENAALFYQKAFDAFVEMPDELHHLKYKDNITDIEKELLKSWLVSNRTAFEYFREAVNKPYYWVKRVSDNTTMGGILTPELNSLRDLVSALVWNARVSAMDGQFRIAFENLLLCYRSGGHLCCPKQLLGDQYLGLRIKSMATENGFSIINSYPVKSDALVFLQDGLKAQIDGDSYLPSLQTEKFFTYDVLQRTFLDNGKGTGRLAWSIGWPKSFLLTEESVLRTKYEETKARLYFCLFGPTRNEMMEIIEELLDQSDKIMRKTPWQIKNEDADAFVRIEKITSSHIFFVVSNTSLNPKNILYCYYKTMAQTDALVAVLAIMRYKNDTGRFPESLNKLVAGGYLHAVPNDPFSNGSLIYNLTEDDFILYSVGEDFADDKGVFQTDYTTAMGFGETAMIPHEYSLDIVYWPVKSKISYAAKKEVN